MSKELNLYEIEYALFTVDSNSKFDFDTATFEDVKKNAIFIFKSKDYNSILRHLILGLNQQIHRDQDWFFVCDVTNKKILYK